MKIQRGHMDLMLGPGDTGTETQNLVTEGQGQTTGRWWLEGRHESSGGCWGWGWGTVKAAGGTEKRALGQRCRG